MKTTSKPEESECGVCNAIANYESERRPWDTKSVTIACISGALVAGCLGFTVSFAAPAFRKYCLPFVPATSEQIRNLLTALNGRSGTLLDIGSGDGRIVIAASKQGFRSYGVELNYWLVLYSRYRAWREGQRKTTSFFRADLWKTDLSKYNNIVVFGTDPLMVPLEKKFEKEVNNDCTVLAARHPLPNWKPLHVIGEGLESVWVYQHPNSPTAEVRKTDTGLKNAEGVKVT